MDNNPVERHICQFAEQYRWNYLAYAASNHPFSEPYRKEKASKAMLRAVHSTTGSEYEMKERFVGKDDSCYAQMTRIILSHCRIEDIHEMLGFKKEIRNDLYFLLRRETMATAGQIAKFLRIQLRRANEMISVEPE